MARIALVTGGTRGIGAAISQALAANGYKVAANYAGNDAAARDFNQHSGIPVYKFDVGDFGQVKESVARIERELGPIDILVNNAGITRDGTLQKMDPQSWDDVVRTNLGSCFNMCRCVIEGMRDRGFGRIVNIGSINGQAGQYGQVNYAAAKSGIHGFTKALAQEGAAKGITVNAIAPGFIETEMVVGIPEKVKDRLLQQIPLKRFGTAEEVARAVVYVCSSDGDYITGAEISINGGLLM